MNRSKQVLSILLLCSLPFSAGARDYSRMYAPETLQRANGVYEKNIRGVLFEDVASFLLDEELATLRRVQLLQPWDRTQDPFEFSANAATGVMLIPTFSVKFFDDLGIATAWFERHDCNTETVFDYVASLDHSTHDLPSPLPALSVPDRAYELDSYVDDVSQKSLKSGLVFIMLHELAHIHQRHRPYHEISAAEAQAQEVEADRFAMRVLRRMSLPPLGVSLWFLAVSMRDPLAPGSPSQTHPLTSSRLEAIAQDLRRSPEDFIEPANRGTFTAETIRGMASNIEAMGRQLSDPDMRSFVRERGRIATPALLSGACKAQDHDKAWLQKLKELVE